jgi:hypothetical protein
VNIWKSSPRKSQARIKKNPAGLLREQVLSYVYQDKGFHLRGAFIVSKKKRKINVEMVESKSNTTFFKALSPEIESSGEMTVTSHLVPMAFDKNGCLARRIGRAHKSR